MEKTLYPTFERYCRLCAEEQEVTLMIFSTEATDMLLVEKVRKYLRIEIEENDKFPKNICIKCCSKLQSLCEFVDLVRKAQDDLYALSSTIEQSNEPTCPITSKADAVEFTEVCIDPLDVLNITKEPSEDLFTYPYAEEIVTLKLMSKNNDSNEENKLQKYSGDSGEKFKQKKKFACQICDKSFVVEQSLKNHSWVHSKEEGRYCYICQKSFTWKTDLKKHMKSHKPSGHKCTICGRRFKAENTYLEHMAIHKLTSKTHNCKICGRSYSSLTGLKIHSITHSPVKPFQCSICQKRFKRNQELKFHMNHHTGEKPYKCPYCDKRFASSGNCYTHKSRVHPEINILKGINDKAISSGTKTYKKPSFYCSDCKSVFYRQENYVFHMFQHTGEKPLKCVQCPKGFLTERSLSSHYDSEHPNFVKPNIVMPGFCNLKRKWCYLR